MSKNFVSILILVFAVLFVISCDSDNMASQKIKKSENAALDQLNEEIRNEPQNHQLFYERAKLYFNEEAFDEALDDIASAQKLDSINPEYYHMKADILLDYYKSYEALKVMQDVVSLHPKRISSLLKLAEFRYILKQYESSIVALNNVLAVDRLEPEAYFMLGMNFRAMGDSERAKNSFQTAVENNPELIDAWLMLGNIYENENDPKALVYYNNALLIAPDNIEALHSKAFYFQNHNEIQNAIEIYRNINILDPSYSEAYLNTGLLYLELDSLARANEHFNIMVKVDFTNPIAYFYRAFTLEQVGEFKKARMDYEQALKLAPDFEEARKALELLMTKEPAQ